MRGSLLPDDERLLAEQWLLVDRSVFEVEQVHRGQGVTVRDVRTGDTHEVRERAASRQLKPGQLVCARVVPAGDTMQFFGLEPVALHERDPLIDLLDTGPDAVTLVAQLSRRFAPPALANTEGDPLAICEATVHVGDPAGIEAALDDTYDRVDGDEPPRWFEHVTTQGMPRIRAAWSSTATRCGWANSEKRMDRVLATLARLDPAMNVLDDPAARCATPARPPSWPSRCQLPAGTRSTPTTPSWPRSSTSSSATTSPGGLDEPIPRARRPHAAAGRRRPHPTRRPDQAPRHVPRR